MIDTGLISKVALITGVNNPYGIGAAAAKAFVAEGAAAYELGQYGITVNVISLGPVQTGWISPELEEKLTNCIPLLRIGQPADVADAIIFFASDQARWITGQLLYVGGGHIMPL